MIDFTGPQPILDDSEPVVTNRRARHGDHLDGTPDESQPGRRSTTGRVREAATDDAAQGSRSRRRMAWRKGSAVDEELWPAEAFGGVSDEQFWDDLAADKPLATTARAARPDAARRRPPGSRPLPDPYPADDRGRGNGRRGAAEGQGTHPQPRLGPDDRTAIAPAQAGIKPSPATATATQPVPAATATLPTPTATLPAPAATATRPVRTAHQPVATRGRSRSGISADEDPLTSPAYSLRPKGSVNGQSYPSPRRSQDLPREQYHNANGTNGGRGWSDVSRSDVSRSDVSRSDVSRSDAGRSDAGRSDAGRSDAGRSDAGRSDGSRSDGSRSDGSRSDGSRSNGYRSDPPRSDPARSGSAYGGTVPRPAYPYPQEPYSQPTQAMSASSQRDRYGYGNPRGSWAQAGPASDPRRANGRWNPGLPGGNGTGSGNRGSHLAYPPANGYRAPYDPRGYDRR